jgi:hypothetical protein
MIDEKHVSAALTLIASCGDPGKLRVIIKNARNAGSANVVRAAQLRLYQISPAAEPGTVEHDVWSCIHALEDALTEERGTTTRLNRTRQKIARDGEHQTVVDLVMGKKSAGFDMMIERDMPQFTFEAVTLRHPAAFDEPCRTCAAERLAGAA